MTALPATLGPGGRTGAELRHARRIRKYDGYVTFNCSSSTIRVPSLMSVRIVGSKK